MHFIKFLAILGVAVVLLTGCAADPAAPDPDIKKLEVVDEKEK